MWQTWLLHGKGPEKRARRAFKKIYSHMLLIAEVMSLLSPCSSVSKSCIEAGWWFPASVRASVGSCWLLPQCTCAHTSLLISATTSPVDATRQVLCLAGDSQAPASPAHGKQQDVAGRAVGPDGAGERDGGGPETHLLFLLPCAVAPLMHGVVQGAPSLPS